MTRTRTAHLVAATAAAAILVATGVLAVLPPADLTASPPADGAATTVPVEVTLVDTAGDPVVGMPLRSYYGPDEEDDWTSARTDAAGEAVLRVPANSTVRLGIPIVRTTAGAPEYSDLTVDAGPTGTTTTILVPVPMAHTYRVVDPQGRPVSKAEVAMDVLVSAVVSDPVRGDYRMAATPPWVVDTPGLPSDLGSHYPGATAADGRTEPMRWWEPEPDPTIACTFAFDPDRCDRDDDGTPDGMFVVLDGPYHPLFTGKAVPYAQWAVPGSQEITLTVPAVPVIEVVDQRRGTRPGEVVLTVRARELKGTSWVPAARLELDAGLTMSNISSSSRGGASPRTDARGLAEIRYRNLAGPTTVSVTRWTRAAVAATVTLKPKRGVLISAAQHSPPGKDTRARASLNREWVSIINTSTAPVSLKKWTVATPTGKRYVFGRYTLRPGATVVLHTGPGKNTRTDRYWGSRRHLWRTSDTATIRRPSGSVVASCHWRYNPDGTYLPGGAYVPEGTVRCVV